MNKRFQEIARKKLETVINSPSSSSNWSDLNYLAFDETAIQLLTTVHIPTNTRCVFSFDSTIPIHTAALINYFIELSPVCRDLILFVKNWQRTHNLALRGYVITILVIVYLQRVKVLPSVYSLQKNEARITRGCK